VIYQIRHLTTYSYDLPVASAKLVLRVTPRDENGQRCFKHGLDISPSPASVVSQHDFYGNVVNVVTIESSHTKLSIEASARVEVSRAPAPTPPGLEWEAVANAALAGRELSQAAPAHFLFSSPRIELSAAVTRYACDSFRPGRGVIEATRELIGRIRDDFAYEPEATEITTPLAQAFAERRGVCQDFAHIMIASLRGLGLPAAYVSGYIRTIPPPGKKRLEGADATHAWVSVWCGPGDGWLGFDPTNAIEAADDHIALAVGRDFSDVSPVFGVFVGAGTQELDVEVDVIPVASQDDAADKERKSGPSGIAG
jgi:transglutaminase-like putative cysteine protease